MTVTTTPANILPTGASGGVWLVQNLGDEAIYLARTAGGADPADGVKVAAFEAVEFRLSTADSTPTIFASTETGTADVRVIRTS